MHMFAGMKFIIGLPFESQNVPLARAQMAMAKQQLPRDSILSFEIGNEVRYAAEHFHYSILVTSVCC